MRASPVMPLLRAAALAGLLAGLLAGPLAGCVSWAPVPPAAVAAGAARPDPAEMRLIEAAERAERALASLARALPAPDPQSGMPRLAGVPAALRTPMTLDWTGPVEALAAELAGRAGYRFAEAGRRPARPLIVAVEAQAQPLIAVLRDLGFRVGGAATLTVDAARETVLLDWSAGTQGEDG